jgi:hypothetical protein
MDRLNPRRAKQSRSAEVRIKFATLSSQCKTALECIKMSVLLFSFCLIGGFGIFVFENCFNIERHENLVM